MLSVAMQKLADADGADDDGCVEQDASDELWGVVWEYSDALAALLYK